MSIEFFFLWECQFKSAYVISHQSLVIFRFSEFLTTLCEIFRVTFINLLHQRFIPILLLHFGIITRFTQKVHIVLKAVHALFFSYYYFCPFMDNNCFAREKEKKNKVVTFSVYVKNSPDSFCLLWFDKKMIEGHWMGKRASQKKRK